MNLDGRVALVTGSTSGIGLGIARALASRGAAVVLNGFGEAGNIARLSEELRSASGAASHHAPADMSVPDQIARMIAETEERLGSLDILVNNAGIQFTAPVEEFPDERWDAIIAVNLSAVFHAAKAAIPGMKRRGWGRIVNIASAHGLVASPQKIAYVAAKHGVVGATKVMALELANTGVTANAICPGWVRTPLVQRQIEARALRDGVEAQSVAREMLAEKQALNEFSTPEQIGSLAAYLCGEDARTITGAALSIDGGWVAQ